MCSEAIKRFEDERVEEAFSDADRHALSALYTKRATVSLQCARQAQPIRCIDNKGLPNQHRPQIMRAGADAAQAVELDPLNAEAWMRRGQALLLMSVMQQRAKEACRCLVEAQRLGLPDSLQAEASEWQ